MDAHASEMIVTALFAIFWAKKARTGRPWQLKTGDGAEHLPRPAGQGYMTHSCKELDKIKGDVCGCGERHQT